MTVVVQGFGNVGSYLAQFLHQEGATVVAISDSTTALYNPKGIDVPAAFAHKRRDRLARRPQGRRDDHDEELLLLDCDILAPCALEQVITEENAERVRASIICEGANGPVTPAADAILEEKGVLDPPRHPRERGRRRRLVLRVGAGPPGVLLEGGRGEREAQRHHEPRVRRDLGDRPEPEPADARRRLRARGAARRRGDGHARRSTRNRGRPLHRAAAAISAGGPPRRHARRATSSASSCGRSRSTAIPSSRPRTGSGSRSSRSTGGGASSTTCTDALRRGGCTERAARGGW